MLLQLCWFSTLHRADGCPRRDDLNLVTMLAHTHTHIYIYRYTCICMHAYMYVCMCIYVYVCVCMYVCMYVYVCMCVHIRTVVVQIPLPMLMDPRGSSVPSLKSSVTHPSVTVLVWT